MPRGIPKSKNPELYGKTQKAKKSKIQKIEPKAEAVNLPFSFTDSNIKMNDNKYDAQQDSNAILGTLHSLNQLRTVGGIGTELWNKLAAPLIERLEERLAEAYPPVTYEVTKEGTKAIKSCPLSEPLLDESKFDSEDDDEPEVIQKPVVSFQPEA